MQGWCKTVLRWRQNINHHQIFHFETLLFISTYKIFLRVNNYCPSLNSPLNHKKKIHRKLKTNKRDLKTTNQIFYKLQTLCKQNSQWTVVLTKESHSGPNANHHHHQPNLSASSSKTELTKTQLFTKMRCRHNCQPTLYSSSFQNCWLLLAHMQSL